MEMRSKAERGLDQDGHIRFLLIIARIDTTRFSVREPVLYNKFSSLTKAQKVARRTSTKYSTR